MILTRDQIWLMSVDHDCKKEQGCQWCNDVANEVIELCAFCEGSGTVEMWHDYHCVDETCQGCEGQGWIRNNY